MTYFDILIQWFFFFALIGVFIIPAVVLRRAAIKVNKTGWHFFLVGLGLGIVGWSFSLFFMQLWSTIAAGGEKKTYMGYMLFVVAYLVIIILISLIKTRVLIKREVENDDVLDSH